jgi:hypothetical protein
MLLQRHTAVQATVAKPCQNSSYIKLFGLALSEKQNPQIVEKPESGYESKEALERVAVLVRQAL